MQLSCLSKLFEPRPEGRVSVQLEYGGEAAAGDQSEVPVWPALLFCERRLRAGKFIGPSLRSRMYNRNMNWKEEELSVQLQVRVHQNLNLESMVI